ncbi:MAG: hypothetical protein US83_C0004G0044 [Candidatus Falkowbacteria bacterium GW2011_GWC2_38_22]|uniref:VWFA domain-containing protein n=1 Tax=Candidatus Falkowbacteria bacterium GW2011_GWE1_38_31 TaxID=1618638 RepID=A0A0G0JT09_9BACT|nr:MAG: hypothetical protein US73_C0002G0073 [Candidatus Falkowbacteria bacterium GW2011_GWF2_38_1205]KKQ61660.1 MAG: hypothetical protein US83_C0004G0044 [Candidatus Falkowbacteria bacterium GW2011_GWC2_38_22]KKQ63725.1 MAG: hypothetical protein US84_C0004G0073 [Candidatus Falkowbacteria bacterium GW2011_GWF1_38_22]KKQ65859.1 MAG: hypothetical protein US87_C0004G0044 [Candidatus Falkowbacteria bacterium GW2011_GWE2_38_254]KKQ70588.1 MAG: hypothetical protein US91_C0004G0073 [Candidatus Falkowb
MSGNTYESYSSSFRSSSKRHSSDEGTRKKADDDYAERIRNARATTGEKKAREERKTEELYDENLVKLGFTHPAKGIRRVHIILIDNSGSNKAIAANLREGSGYLSAVLNVIDPESQFAFNYFSDHCDGIRISQVVDFISPDKTGDKILFSTVKNIFPADGGDAAEAIECVLWDVCNIDFGDVTEKHLYLVSDVVAHGMGMDSDNGCPNQRNWRDSVKKVMETFTTFEVVGCGDLPKVGELQKQFLSPDKVAFDFIDLSGIREHRHRLGIVANAILFLVARHRGLQAVELFLSSLYEKWLSDPVFGENTDINARAAIKRFAKYLDISEEEKDRMMDKIFV